MNHSLMCGENGLKPKKTTKKPLVVGQVGVAGSAGDALFYGDFLYLAAGAGHALDALALGKWSGC